MKHKLPYKEWCFQIINALINAVQCADYVGIPLFAEVFCQGLGDRFGERLNISYLKRHIHEGGTCKWENSKCARSKGLQ